MGVKIEPEVVYHVTMDRKAVACILAALRAFDEYDDREYLIGLANDISEQYRTANTTIIDRVSHESSQI